MTLVISKGITLRKGYIGTDDPDAEAYIAAVEAADEAESPGVGALETATKVAIHSFVKGCKADGIWPAIKASCILAGARTLTGALVPLVGAAPTNFNFVAGDYNRKTGLKGNPANSTTLVCNYGHFEIANSLRNKHFSAYLSESETNNGYVLSERAGLSSTGLSGILTGTGLEIRVDNPPRRTNTTNLNFLGLTSNTTQGIVRDGNATFTLGAANADFVGSTGGFYLLSRTGSQSYGNARVAIYTIGSSIDIAKLDARVTDLINAFGAAIP
jgi:hypothetical protein